MPCEVRKENGMTMILCSRGQQPKEKCYICGRPAPFLCDGEIAIERSINSEGDTATDWVTCDRPICGYHAYMPNAFEDKHLCPECRKIMEAESNQ
jgi:hypothetical protein